MDLYHLFEFDMENPVYLSLCGAGGKTTLLYALCREANLYGKKASLLTTALMKTPHEEDMFVFYGYGSKWMHKVWKFRQIIVAGGNAGRGMLNMADQATIDFQLRYADLVAVKADYSEGLPLVASPGRTGYFAQEQPHHRDDGSLRPGQAFGQGLPACGPGPGSAGSDPGAG